MEYREIAKYILTGSPNWFQSNVVAVTKWQTHNDGGCAFVAFTSRSYIHIFIVKQETNVECQPNYSWSCVGQIVPHQGKISAVAFDECACLRVVSCGLDGLVRRWTYFSQEWLLETEFNMQNVQGNISPTAVSCFSNSANESYNFVGTDKGLLLVWVVDCNTNKSYHVSKKFEDDPVVMCAWEKSTVVPSISRVAVGYKRGIVCVYSFGPSDIFSTPSIVQLTRIYAHKADICHIVWRQGASASSSDPELLTCGRDQMVKVWNVTTSECTSSYQVPGHLREQFGNARRQHQKSEQNGAPWISACYTPGSDSSVNVLFSSVRGGLFHWDCKGTPNSMLLDGQGHSMLIFSMHYLLNSPGLVITFSQDRFLIIWQLVEGSNLSVILKVPTMSAGVCSLAQSEFSNGPLVAGLSDGSILFWKFPAPELFGERNSSDNQNKERFVSISPRGCKSPITTLSCHPLRQFENVIAYGTESGCVEIVDINNLRKMKSQKPKPQLYAFGSTVYRVAWGPLLFSDICRRKANKSKQNTSENHSRSDNPSASTTHIIAQEDENSTEDNEALSKFSFYVYSISKGKVYCHFGCSRPPIDVSTKFPPFPDTTDEDWKALIRSEISFRLVSKSELPEVDLIADTFYCLVAVGYRSGEVDIYGFLRSKSLNCEEKVVGQESRRLVFICRTVNHSKCVNCLTWSRDHYWLAVGSNETFITVTDLKIQLINYLNQGECSKPIQLSTSLARLEGHYNRITCLDWSPHDPFLLLSASFDGTANVWRIHPENIEKDNFSISNFRALRLRHFACLWSRQEPDLAFSGGESCHLFGWQPSEQLFSQPPHTRRYRPPTVKKLVNDQEAPSNGDILCYEPVPTETESLPDSKPLNDKESEQKKVIKSNDILPSGTSHQEMSIPLQCNSSQKVNFSGIGDKMKRPALFPNLFNFMNTNCELDLDNSPPIQLGSFLSQILNASNFVTEQVNDEQVQIDLLLLLPQAGMTRACLLKYLNMEASAHLKSFHCQQKPNSLVHLDAYCIILLWMGHALTVPSIMSSENYMPFWLLYAVELTRCTLAYPDSCGKLSSSSEKSESVELDLLGEKIRNMQTTSADTLISATLLVCAHRIHEAIELLLSYDKVKEALILAHFHLKSSEVVIYTEKCIKRFIDRSSSVEKVFFSIIFNIGKKQWISAMKMVHRAVEISKIRPGKEIEQLSWCWVGINLLLNASSSNHNDYLSNECLRLSSMCLTVSFRLFPKEPLFLNRWYEAFSRLLSSSSETTPCPGIVCSLMLLNIGQIAHFYMVSYQEENEEAAAALVVNNGEENKEVVYGCLKNDWMKSITSDCLTYFSQLIADRQPSSLWEVCLTHFCIDFLLFYLIHNHCTLNKLVQLDTLTAYIDRYEASRKSCECIKPRETSYLIRHLFSTYKKILITNGLNTDSEICCNGTFNVDA